MKNIFATLLITSVTLAMSTAGYAATAEQKTTYKAAKDTASADYKTNRAKCDSLTGNPKDVCVEEAKAARTRMKEEAEAAYKGTPRAMASARKEIAKADYGVAKAKCGAMTGNEKDVCIKEAKAALKVAEVDAKADKKVGEVRTEARDDKRDAQYKVAAEKCDALAGAAKDTCQANAKSTYGK